jgi:hypothetical protein
VLDGLLVLVVLALAFVCASFPVGNSDFFRQLATGRLLAGGEYSFGEDPFTWVSPAPRWVNHSWLFALLVYGLHAVPGIGGVLVVGFKAVLVTLLAALMVVLGRRPGQGLAVAAACAGLALVAMSQRLQMQPSVVSFVFFGLTLWLLRLPRLRRQAGAAPGGNPYRSFWLLPVLFVLWVNVDSWFVLGPLAVALYLAGEWVGQLSGLAEGPDTPGPGELRALVIALVVGLAACLINPYGYRAFGVPEQLLASRVAGTEASQVISPLSKTYLNQWVPAVLAYLPLLGLLAVSFVLAVLGRGGLRVLLGWRLFLALPLAALSIYSLRGIPFFAVVAAPVMALNLLDASPRPAQVPRPQWLLGALARGAAVAVALLAVVAAVPGQLQGSPRLFRVGWRIEPDLALRHAAEQIDAWVDQGKVAADTHWFNLAPEVAPYLAWYAHGQRTLLDNRSALPDDVAEELRAVRRSLEPNRPQGELRGEPAWRRFFRSQKVHFLVLVTDPKRPGWELAVAPLNDPVEWDVCYLDGRIGVFAWKDPALPGTLPVDVWSLAAQTQLRQSLAAGPAPYLLGVADATITSLWRQALHYDTARPPPATPLGQDSFRLAFGPDAEAAPLEAPERPAGTRPWWEEWWAAPQPANADAGLAWLHELRFRARRNAFVARYHRDWSDLLAATIPALGATPGGPVLNGVLLPVQFSRVLGSSQTDRPARWAFDRAGVLHDSYVSSQDAGPPDALYLAIRAARRALAANPRDEVASFCLGKAYFELSRHTREGALTRGLPRLAQVRHDQIVAALSDALRGHLSPVLAREAHEMLATVYDQPPQMLRSAYLPQLPVPLHFRDLAVKHIREMQRLEPEGSEGEPGRVMAQQLDRLEVDIQDRKDKYETNTAGKPVLQKLAFALEQELGETALNIVLNDPEWSKLSEDDRMRPVAVSLTLNLLLALGRLDEAQQILDPGKVQLADPVLVRQNFWELVRRSAVTGDYDAADRFLAEAMPPDVSPGATARMMAAVQIEAFLLRQAPRAAGMPWQVPVTVGQQREVVLDPASDWESVAMTSSYTTLAQLNAESEVYVVRAMLALEAGRTALADEQLALAYTLTVPPEQWEPLLKSLRGRMPLQIGVPLMQEIRPAQTSTRLLVERCRGWIKQAGGD